MIRATVCSVAAGLLALLPSSRATAQLTLTDNLTPDAERAPFVYEDLHNFARAFELLAAGGDSVGILQVEYFDKGSPGLGAFIWRYDLTPERLLAAIRQHPAEYAGISEKAAVLAAHEHVFRDAYAGLKRLVPDAAFTPTYFLVGAYRGIGSGSEEGPLITVEKESMESLRGGLVTMLIHEMVHMQQVQAIGLEKYRAIFGPEKSLLALTVREGIAEYYAYRVTGHMTQDEAQAFVREHERELWEEFQQEMLGSETGDWMWATPNNPAQPPHIAYVMGARITECRSSTIRHSWSAAATLPLPNLPALWAG
jgi:hypothetical protein